jgi:chemotaxis protein methyltransferase CheR
MTQEEYLLLNELITNEMGISFPEHKRELLEARLRPRLHALRLSRYIEYYFLLQAVGRANGHVAGNAHGANLTTTANITGNAHGAGLTTTANVAGNADPADAAEGGERAILAELVTNNETYFFRETQQFDALFEQALDGLKPGAASPGALRVLIAGCSSGEEAYTLGIVARQNFVRMAGTALTVDAFDIDGGRIAMARRAEYGGGSFRATSGEQLERSFLPAGEGRWSVKPLFRAGTRFQRGNILEGASFAAALPYDVVFCRNVLIYFSEPALHRAVANFAAVLRRGGILFLGHAESIIGLSASFESLRLRNLIAYRKVQT